MKFKNPNEFWKGSPIANGSTATVSPPFVLPDVKTSTGENFFYFFAKYIASKPPETTNIIQGFIDVDLMWNENPGNDPNINAWKEKIDQTSPFSGRSLYQCRFVVNKKTKKRKYKVVDGKEYDILDDTPVDNKVVFEKEEIMKEPNGSILYDIGGLKPMMKFVKVEPGKEPDMSKVNWNGYAYACVFHNDKLGYKPKQNAKASIDMNGKVVEKADEGPEEFKYIRLSVFLKNDLAVRFLTYVQDEIRKVENPADPNTKISEIYAFCFIADIKDKPYDGKPSYSANVDEIFVME